MVLPAASSLAALESGLVLAPVLRRRAHTPAFFLSHLSFGDSALATRILQELAAGNAPNQKERVYLAFPFKVALARAPSRPALQDVLSPRVPSLRAPIPVPTLH